MELLDNDKNFKEAIGEFVIAFSELEFGLASLCSFTDFDLRKQDKSLMKFIGYSFEQKRRHLSDFIKENLPQFKPSWEKVNEELGQLNRERRFLVHGFSQYYLPHESISTHVKENGQLTTKNQTLKEIKDLTQKLYKLISGENGICGHFHTEFAINRINEWNDLVNDNAKLFYRENGKILSDWKGL